LVHVVDSAGLKSAARKHAAVSKQAIAALTKAGDRILRHFEGLTRMALQQATTKPHTTIETMLAHGRVADTVTKLAQQKKADLLVLGSRGLSDAESYLLGSVSRKVTALAACPVLVVKRPVTTLSRVLFAADASKHSQGACSFLCKRFLPETAHVTVLSIVEPVLTELAVKYLSKDQLEQISTPKRQAAEQVVERLRDRFLSEGYAVTTEVHIDHVTDAILEHATTTKVDLLVAGSRGLTGSERLRMGSVSETLLKYAPCAVLIVRGWRA
jgi:nucleotide-binding universal stress UspA family protein